MSLQAPSSSSRHDKLWRVLGAHLNFFRIHVIFFTLTPLIFSGIFYASNGKYPVTYIDALFNSISAMTMCGLESVNWSQLTPWQQVLLFTQICIGNPVIVSWVIVYTRRYYFVKKLEHIIQAEVAGQAAAKVEQQLTAAHAPAETSSGTRDRWFHHVSTPKSGLRMVQEVSSSHNTRTIPKDARRLRSDMIRRMDSPPKPINPSGLVTDSGSDPMKHKKSSTASSDVQEEEQLSLHHQMFADEISRTVERTEVKNIHVTMDNTESVDLEGTSEPSRRICHPDECQNTIHSGSKLPLVSAAVPASAGSNVSPGMPRTATINFMATDPHVHPPIHDQTGRPDSPSSEASSDTSPVNFSTSFPRRRRPSVVSHGSHISMARHPTTQTRRSRRPASLYPPQSFDHVDQPREQVLRGFGGFPMPHELLGMLFGWLFPSLKHKLKKTMTIPVTTTLTGVGLGRTTSGPTCESERLARGGSTRAADGSKPVAYISFDAVVGRNSVFHLLSDKQLEELGGVEYRALNALLWLVGTYHLAIQLISFAVIAPYMSMSKWESDFEPPALIRKVASPWFSLFQVVSAYGNSGASLVDQNMVPFQTAYPMIFFMMLCILAGNTAFPILLRFFIWSITKVVPQNSRLQETLHFLLDHPRRCFIYLFPSYQTWFLLTMLVILNLTDWLSFMVLDIGNPDIDTIPLGTRFLAGLFQAISVRTGGFAIVPLAGIAPAVKVMYVIMMYISVYPIALSVRSTNVYEEQSLGIYKHEESGEISFSTNGSRMTVWSRYLAMHARRQLSFDMWWLCLALVLVCIIERNNLNNTEIQGWFNIFTIIFELVSAYGIVGLSLGIPNENYSFSGALHPLSKLIVCFVMLRGRHRGLPVAIDRAILLPSEFTKTKDEPTVHTTHTNGHSSVRSESPRPLQKENGDTECFEG